MRHPTLVLSSLGLDTQHVPTSVMSIDIQGAQASSWFGVATYSRCCHGGSLGSEEINWSMFASYPGVIADT